MASNDETLDDEDGTSSDWIEVHNAGLSSVNLAGWTLSDDADDLSKWAFPSTSLAPGAYRLVFASGKDRKPVAGEWHANFKLSAGGEYLALVRPDGSVEQDFGATYPLQVTDVAYGLDQVVSTEDLVDSTSVGMAGVPTSAANFATNFSLWNSSLTGSFSSPPWRTVNTGIGYDTATTFGQWLATNGDFQSEMRNVNASVFLRIPFSASDPSSIDSLRLWMRWDDGFVAYINGVEVARDFAPTTLGWNSTSTGIREDELNEDPERFDIDLTSVSLNTGTNLLAIHGLNRSTGSSDMLIQPRLEAVSSSGLNLQAIYIPSPTPGVANEGGVANLAPLLSNSTETLSPLPTGNVSSPAHPVSVQVDELNAGVATVTLHYRTMFAAEQSLALSDNGLAPDLIADDGIYTGMMPTNGPLTGEMLRWRFEVLDQEGNVGQLPSYSDPDDSDQYFGSMAQDPTLATSQLPILHWFIESPTAANNRTGTRASFSYLGRFYDNIQVDLHGQTTAGFPKKSYDIDFNKGDRRSLSLCLPGKGPTEWAIL